MKSICTKFVPPLEPLNFLDRPRLRERVDQMRRRRVTLVQAPAGCGKTTLLAQWRDEMASRGALVGWLTPDSRERDGQALIGSLATMLAQTPGIGEDLGTNAWQRPFMNAEALLALIVERLSAVSEPILLFLDDVHALDVEAGRALGDFIARAPHNLRIALGTRDSRHIELAAMRAYGTLDEIGVNDLSFTVAEAAALLAGAGHKGLTENEVSALVKKSEGWVAGLKLASLGIAKDTDCSAFIIAFSGRRRAIADYFEEDVFAGLRLDVQRFLLDTAILDRLTPSLCDAMTGRAGSATMLRELEERGLFLMQMDDEGSSFRYHSLFSDFLQRKLADSAPEALPSLHRKAATWLESDRQVVDALEHALKANDFELLAVFLERHTEELTVSGNIGIVARFAVLLPEKVLAEAPQTALALAWLRIRKLDFARARDMVRIAEAALEHYRADPRCVPETVEIIEQTLRHRSLMLSIHDEPARIEQKCNELIATSEHARPMLTCAIHGQLAVARRDQYRFDRLDKLYAQARLIAERPGQRVAKFAVQEAFGPTLYAAGRSDAALEVLQDGLAECERWAGPNPGIGAPLALLLSDILYESNELDRASRYLDAYLPVSRQGCLADQLVPGHLTRIRLAVSAGDATATRRALDDAMRVALEADLEGMRPALLHEQVRLHLRNGQPDAAIHVAAEADVGADDPKSLHPHVNATPSTEHRAAMWVRLAISRDCMSEALGLAKHWREFCGNRGAVRSTIRWAVMAAQILMLKGDTRAAQRMMREAIALAAGSNIVRSFVDEGPAVFNILAEAYADATESQHPTDIFARRVLDTFDNHRPVAGPAAAHVDEGLYGRLSGRELEILTLVGCGMRNREIGNRLGLSEGSVKWYMQQVYDKVGIRRRSQAVERARQFGLIA